MSGNIIAVFSALVFPLGGFFYKLGSDIGEAFYGESPHVVIIISLAGLAVGVVLGCLASWYAVSLNKKEDKKASETLQKSLYALEKRLRKEFNKKINVLKSEVQDLQVKNFGAASTPEPEIEIQESKPEEIPEVQEIIDADKERQEKLAKTAATTATVAGTAAGLGAGAQLGATAGFWGGPWGMVLGAIIGGIAGLIAGNAFGSDEEL